MYLYTPEYQRGKVPPYRAENGTDLMDRSHPELQTTTAKLHPQTISIQSTILPAHL